uniref:Major capsid protein n=1 Tax=Army ant associated bidensovirus 1 TaxID=3004028 RepID=A0A9Y1MSZ6_9VIRU|nr:MAG: major capsid protein [Army ant associated bidensovirus 1]
MFKRHGTNSENPAEKGSPAPAAAEKQNPIPRNLPSQSIHLKFVKRGWEEIAPGSLYYLPLCQNPKYMFDTAMINQFNKFRELWHTMEIHTPKARISNLIMLQDDLRVQNNTPTDATAFTQVVYMMKYHPKGQKQYFKLVDIPDEEHMDQVNNLTYKLQPQKPAGESQKSQLIQIEGFKDFESLGILGAKAGLTAGFIPYGPLTFDENQVLQDPYVAPNTSTNTFRTVAGNMKPADNTATFIPPTYCVTFAKNQDSLTFHKYGEAFDIPIRTNIEGMHLMNTPSNDFFNDQYIKVTKDEKEYRYATEFCWPSRNRPWLSRNSYFDINTHPIMSGKHEGTLDHTFLCMPPIRKPNGTLLGQRCSVYLEQEIEITLHANQATFFDNETDDALQVNQDNQIVLRRNVYPTPTVTEAGRGFFCDPKEESKCDTDDEYYVPSQRKKKQKLNAPECYLDTAGGMCQAIHTNQKTLDTTPFCTFTQEAAMPPGAVNLQDDFTTPQKIAIKWEQITDPSTIWFNILSYWESARDTTGSMTIWWGRKEPVDSGSFRLWAFGPNSSGSMTPVIWQNTTAAAANCVKFNVQGWLQKFFAVTKQKCVKKPAKADPEPGDKTSLVFFV